MSTVGRMVSGGRTNSDTRSQIHIYEIVLWLQLSKLNKIRQLLSRIQFPMTPGTYIYICFLDEQGEAASLSRLLAEAAIIERRDLS